MKTFPSSSDYASSGAGFLASVLPAKRGTADIADRL
jgi:hypothetical protein